jgi:hypothetical protein
VLNILTTLLLLTACSGSGPEVQDLAPAPEPAATEDAKTDEAVADDAKTDEAATDGADAAEEADPNAITADNWKTHPKIKRVRRAVSQIKKAAKTPSWTEMNHSFEDHCGEQGIHKVGIGHPEESDSVLRFHIVEGQGDLSRETTAFYSEEGQAIFAMSTYSNSSAESTQLARVYYAAGEVLFVPAVEQTSDKAGPTDDTTLEELVLLTADAARARFFEVAKMCHQ